jgi:hypothetical protein
MSANKISVLCTLVGSLLLVATAQAGVRFVCADENNQPLPIVKLPPSQFPADNAAATIMKGQRIIILGQNFERQPLGLQNMIIAHECGHHALGHTKDLHPRSEGPGSPMTEQESAASWKRELDADCFGVRAILSKGILSIKEIEAMAHDYAKFMLPTPNGDTHPGGEIRMKALLQCVQLGK